MGALMTPKLGQWTGSATAWKRRATATEGIRYRPLTRKSPPDAAWATALGGLGSPAVVGLQRSIRGWAMRQGRGDRPVRVEQAQGILIAGLGMLKRHYGYG
jgi:hypothetical protein